MYARPVESNRAPVCACAHARARQIEYFIPSCCRALEILDILAVSTAPNVHNNRGYMPTDASRKLLQAGIRLKALCPLSTNAANIYFVPRNERV